MQLKYIYQEFTRLSEYLQSFALFFARITLAYGFYNPAMMKWNDINSVANWFETLGIPMPLFNAYMAATTEIAGVVLLTLGLFTRIISIPLIVVMIVAIITVHLPYGFEAGNNGFEIPLYYILFLFLFLSYGAGKFSIDYFLEKK